MIPVWVRVTGHAEVLLKIIFWMESSQTAALDCLCHGVVGPSSSTGLDLGHAELWLQEQMQATVGQQQRALDDPGERRTERLTLLFTAYCIAFCKAAVMWLGIPGNSDSPVLSCLCCTVSKSPFIDLWNHSYFSKNLWSPFMRSVICWALFRLKKGFFGGSSGSCTLQKTHTDSKNDRNQSRWPLTWKLEVYCSRYCTYISIEFACSFCLSHTNSLYLLLTLEIFLVKQTLSVWNRWHVYYSNTYIHTLKQLSFITLLTCKQIS